MDWSGRLCADVVSLLLLLLCLLSSSLPVCFGASLSPPPSPSIPITCSTPTVGIGSMAPNGPRDECRKPGANNDDNISSTGGKDTQTQATLSSSATTAETAGALGTGAQSSSTASSFSSSTGESSIAVSSSASPTSIAEPYQPSYSSSSPSSSTVTWAPVDSGDVTTGGSISSSSGGAHLQETIRPSSDSSTAATIDDTHDVHSSTGIFITIDSSTTADPDPPINDLPTLAKPPVPDPDDDDEDDSDGDDSAPAASSGASESNGVASSTASAHAPVDGAVSSSSTAINFLSDDNSSSTGSSDSDSSFTGDSTGVSVNPSNGDSDAQPPPPPAATGTPPEGTQPDTSTAPNGVTSTNDEWGWDATGADIPDTIALLPVTTGSALLGLVTSGIVDTTVSSSTADRGESVSLPSGNLDTSPIVSSSTGSSPCDFLGLSPNRSISYCFGGACIESTGLEMNVDGAYAGEKIVLGVMIAMKLEIDLAQWQSADTDYAARFERDIAESITPPLAASRVRVIRVTPGSTIVSFELLPGAGIQPTSAAIQLILAAELDQSPLYRPDSLTSLLARNHTIAVTTIETGECLDGSWTTYCASLIDASESESDSSFNGVSPHLLIGVTCAITLGILIGIAIIIHLKNRRAKVMEQQMSMNHSNQHSNMQLQVHCIDVEPSHKSMIKEETCQCNNNSGTTEIDTPDSFLQQQHTFDNISRPIDKTHHACVFKKDSNSPAGSNIIGDLSHHTHRSIDFQHGAPISVFPSTGILSNATFMSPSEVVDCDCQSADTPSGTSTIPTTNNRLTRQATHMDRLVQLSMQHHQPEQTSMHTINVPDEDQLESIHRPRVDGNHELPISIPIATVSDLDGVPTRSLPVQSALISVQSGLILASTASLMPHTAAHAHPQPHIAAAACAPHKNEVSSSLASHNHSPLDDVESSEPSNNGYGVKRFRTGPNSPSHGHISLASPSPSFESFLPPHPHDQLVSVVDFNLERPVLEVGFARQDPESAVHSEYVASSSDSTRRHNSMLSESQQLDTNQRASFSVSQTQSESNHDPDELEQRHA